MKKTILISLIMFVTVSSSGSSETRDLKALGEQGIRRGLISAPRGWHDFTKIPANASYKPGELLVRFAPRTNGKQRTKAEREAVLAAIGGGNIRRSYRLVPGLSVVKLPKGLSVEKALRIFNTKSEILYAEPDYYVEAVATPNDPNFSDLWGMHNTGQEGGTADADIDAPEAWDLETDANEIIVAVIDTGVDYGHPDLSANMWTDANGFRGKDFVNDDNSPMDDNFHGTHCAGTIGAVGDNNQGVTGVCWDVQVMALKFLDEYGRGDINDAIASIEYAVQNGAKVLSNSWGGYSYSESLKEAIEAADANGVLFVAAAGNDYASTEVWPHYPSSYDCNNIIAVLSTDRYDELSSFSNYGLISVDVGAPGSDILSTMPRNKTTAMNLYGLSTYYDELSGTSMATPHVAGACALVWSEYPTLTHLEVKEIILETIDVTLPGLCVSGGRLNLHNALINKNVQNITQDKWYDTIQGAIDDANNGDVIKARPGTYYENVEFKGKCITLSSLNPDDPNVIAATIIDANDSGRVVSFSSSNDSNTVLTGLTITGGNQSTYGGGIYCFKASPTISHCLIKDNYGNNGGGIFIFGGSPTITDCTFSGNTTDKWGGAMSNYSSLSLGTVATLTKCTFVKNTAYFDGGAIYNSYTYCEAADCVFADNNSTGGGAIYSLESPTTLTNCVFVDNSASHGGAVYYDTTSGSMTNCLFTGNTATVNAGAVEVDYNSADVNIVNCTFSGNDAGSKGGALLNVHSSPKVSNCILWNDDANDGNEVYNWDANSDPNFRCCDIEGCGGSGGGWDPNLGTDGGGNIDQDPNFVDSNDPNGDDDIWATADDGLALDCGSHCIDAGDNDAIGLAGDIAGNFRRRDATCRIDTGAPPNDAPYADMGPYEHAGEPVTIYVDVNGTGGVYDGLAWSTAVQDLKEAVDYTIEDDQVHVAQGSYVLSATVFVDEKVDIYGGYDASTGQRDWQSNTTTVDGANAVRCFYLTADCNVDGFTITRGFVNRPLPIGPPWYGDSGAAVAIEANDPNVANCTFTNNAAKFDGGGLYTGLATDASVTNCLFSGNSGAYGGALAAINPNSVTVTDSLFNGNSASGVGGAVYLGDLAQAQPDVTISDCNFYQNTAPLGGAMYANDGAAGSKVTRSTFTENDANEGGAVMIEWTGPTIDDCNFYKNTADWGGAMFNYNGGATVTDCNFTENSADECGGVIYNFKGTGQLRYSNLVDNSAQEKGGAIYSDYLSTGSPYSCTLSGNYTVTGGGGAIYSHNSSTGGSCSTFTDNTSPDNGGAIYNDNSSPGISSCHFNANTAEYDGGAIYNTNGSVPDVENSVFSLNTADNGGGIADNNSSPIIDDCVFTKNVALYDGGGIYNTAASSANVTSCVFYDCNAADGAGIYNDDSSPIIINCTFFENEADDDGGGIYNDDSSPSIYNCILWEDTAGGSGDEIYNAGSSNPDVDYCFIDEDPNFVDPNDPDGSDDEWATDDDGLYPQDDECINEGDNDSAQLDYDDADVTGNSRIEDDYVDLGAYEWDPD
ncbi:MAG: S8 family serine peptidase [Planctomycetota bacterium]|jgi:predicted outer membrane repeat protein